MSNNDRRDGHGRGRGRGYVQRGKGLGQFQRGRGGGNWRNRENNFRKNQNDRMRQGRERNDSPRPEVEYMDDSPNRSDFSPRWINDNQEEYEERNAVYYEDELEEEGDEFLRGRGDNRFIVEDRFSEGRNSRDRNHSPPFQRDLRDDMSRRSGRSWDNREDFVDEMRIEYHGGPGIDERRETHDLPFRDEFPDNISHSDDRRHRSRDRGGCDNRSNYNDNDFKNDRDGGRRDIHENLSPDEQYDRVSEYEEVSDYDQVSEYDDVSEYDEVSEYETVSEDNDDFPENSGFDKSQNSKHRNRLKRKWSPTNEGGPDREREFHNMPQVGPDGQLPPGMQVMGEPGIGQVLIDERQEERGFRGRFNARGRGRGRFNRNNEFDRQEPFPDQANRGQVVLDPNMVPVGMPNIIGPGVPIVNVPGGVPVIVDPNIMPPGNLVQPVFLPVQGIDQQMNDQTMHKRGDRFPDRSRDNRSHDRDNRRHDFRHGDHRKNDGRGNDRRSNSDRSRDRRESDNRHRERSRDTSSESRGRYQGRHSSKERSREKKSSEDFSKQLRDVISEQKKSSERNDDAMISLLKSALDVMQEKIRKKESSSKSSDSRSGQSKSSSSGNKPRESSVGSQSKPGDKRSHSSSDDKRDAKKPRVEEKKSTSSKDSSDTKDRKSSGRSSVAERKETGTVAKKAVKKETESTKAKSEKKETKTTDVKEEKKDSNSSEVLEANPDVIKTMSEKLETLLEKQKEGGKVDDNMVTLLKSALDVAKKRTGNKMEKASEKPKAVPKQPLKPVKFSIKGQERESELQKSAVQETWMTEIIDSDEEPIQEDSDEKSKEDDLKVRSSLLLQGKKRKEEPVKLDISAIQSKDQQERDTSIIKRNKLPSKYHLRKTNQQTEEEHDNEQAIMVRIQDRRKTDKEKQHEKSETANKQSHNAGSAIPVIGKSQSQNTSPWAQTSQSVHSTQHVVPSQFSRPPPAVQPQYPVPQALQLQRPVAPFSQPPPAVLPAPVVPQQSVPQMIAQPHVQLTSFHQQPPIAVQPFVPRPAMFNPQNMAVTVPTSQFLEQLATVATKILPQLATVAATASAIAPRLQPPIMNITQQPRSLMPLVASNQRPALQQPTGFVSHAPVMNQPPKLITTKVETPLPSGPIKAGVSEDLLRIQQRAIEVMAKETEKKKEEEAQRNTLPLQTSQSGSQPSTTVTQVSGHSSTGIISAPLNQAYIGLQTSMVPQTSIGQQGQSMTPASQALMNTVVAQQPIGVPPPITSMSNQPPSTSQSQPPVQPLFPVSQANVHHFPLTHSSVSNASSRPSTRSSGNTLNSGQQLHQGYPRKDESTFSDHSVSKPPQKYDNKEMNQKAKEHKSNEKKLYTAAELLKRISAAKAQNTEQLKKKEAKKENKPATTVITTNQGIKKTVLVSEAKALRTGPKSQTGTPPGNKNNKNNTGKPFSIGKKNTPKAKPLWKPEPTKIEEKKDNTASLENYKSLTGEVIKNIPTIENNRNTGPKNNMKPPNSTMSNVPPNPFPNFSRPPPIMPMQNMPRPGDPRFNVPGFPGPGAPRFGVPNIPDFSRQRFIPPPGLPAPAVAYPHLQQIARPPLFPAAVPASVSNQVNQIPVSSSTVVQTTLPKLQPLVPYTNSPPREEIEKKQSTLTDSSSRGRSPSHRQKDDRYRSSDGGRDFGRSRNESPKRSSGRGLSPSQRYSDGDHHHRRSLTPTRPDYDSYGRSPAYRDLSPGPYDSSYRSYHRGRSLSPGRMPYPDRGDLSPRYMYSDRFHPDDFPRYRELSPDPYRYRESSHPGYPDRYQELDYDRSPSRRYDSSPSRRYHSDHRRHSLSPPRRNASPSRRRELSPLMRRNRSISPPHRRRSTSPELRRSPSSMSHSPISRRSGSPRRHHCPSPRRYGSPYPRRRSSLSPRRSKSPQSRRRGSLSPRRPDTPHLHHSGSRSPMSSSLRPEQFSPSSDYNRKYSSSSYNQYSSMPHEHSPSLHKHSLDSSPALDQQTSKGSDRYRRSLSPIYRKAYSSTTHQKTELSGNAGLASMSNQSQQQYGQPNNPATTENSDAPLPGVLTNLLKNLGSTREIGYKPMSKSMADLLGNVHASKPPESKPQGTYPVGILKKPGGTQKPVATEGSSILEPSGKLPEHLFQKLSAWIPNAFGQNQGQGSGPVPGQNTIQAQNVSPLKTPDSSYSQHSYLEESKSSNVSPFGVQRSTGMEESYQSFLDVIGYKKNDIPSDPKIPGLDVSNEGKKDAGFVVPGKPPQPKSYIDMYTTKPENAVPGLGQSQVQNNSQSKAALFNRPISYNRPGVFPSAARLQQILRK